MTARNRRRIALVVVLAGVAVATPYLIRHYRTSRQFRAARDTAARHHYAEAAGLLEEYLRDNPGDGEAWLLAARTARQRGDPAGAAKLLREAEKNAADALALDLEKRLAAFQAGNLRGADEELRRCGGQPPPAECPLVLQAIAEGAAARDDAPRLRRAAQLWLERSATPDDRVLGLIWTGMAGGLEKGADAAVESYQQAVDTDPDHFRARVLLAAVLVERQPDRAKSHVEYLLRKHPDDIEVQFQAARLHHAVGELEQARSLLDKLLAKNPDLVLVLVERARVAMDLTRPHEAEEFLRRAMSLAPGNRNVHVANCDCLRLAGKDQEAKACVERVRAADEQGTRTKAESRKQP